MSNYRTRLNRLANLSSFLRAESVPCDVTVQRADGSIRELEAVLRSHRREQDIAKAQELADFAREAFGVYEDRAGYSIVVVLSDPPRADRWTLAARCDPRQV